MSGTPNGLRGKRAAQSAAEASDRVRSYLETVAAATEEMGHTIRPVSGYGRGIFGRGQVILWDDDQEVFWSGSAARVFIQVRMSVSVEMIHFLH